MYYNFLMQGKALEVTFFEQGQTHSSLSLDEYRIVYVSKYVYIDRTYFIFMLTFFVHTFFINQLCLMDLYIKQEIFFPAV